MASKPKRVSVQVLNDNLAAGMARAEELEGRYVRLLLPVLNRAGDQAATRFVQHATDFMTASVPLNTYRPLNTPGVTAASCMVALYPRTDEAEAFAEDGGEDPSVLHVTLCYLGEIEPEVALAVADRLRHVAINMPPLEGVVGGVGSFDDNGKGHPAILLPSVPGLTELRQQVCEAVLAAGADYPREHGWLPHLTIAYRNGDGPRPPAGPLGHPLHFDNLHVAQGNQDVAVMPLLGAEKPLTAAAAASWAAPYPNELVDVDALTAELRGKTDPVRLATVRDVMTPVLAAAGLSFDVTNPLTAKAFASTGQHIRNIAETTQVNVMRIVKRSYEEGLSIPDTAKAIRSGMREANTARSTLITRCLPADALVDGAVVRAVTRRWYEGDMIVAITESGREFTATPNHPMLTSRGWRAADEIKEGDHLVCRSRDKDPRSSSYEDVSHPPSTIAEVFEAAATVGIIERRRGGEPDFHGDGLNGEVDIARPYRELKIGSFAALYQHRGEQVFTPSVVIDGASFCSCCGRLLSIDQSPCLCRASTSDSGLTENSLYEGIRSTDARSDCLRSLAACVAVNDERSVNVLAQYGGATATLEVLETRSAKRTSLNPSFNQPVKNDTSVYADLSSDGSATQTVTVEVDRVVSRRLVEFADHVYNLVTPYGYFTTNGGYTGNTELVGAANSGALAATQIVGNATGVQYFKSWLTSAGARHPRHELYQGLDGQKRALGDTFDVGGAPMQHPGDPNGPVGECANCRCATTFSETRPSAEEEAQTSSPPAGLLSGLE